jgi:hypothetical protein
VGADARRPAFEVRHGTGPQAALAWRLARVSLSLGAVGGIATRTIVAALAGLWLASACRQLNESHCGNQDGSATCMLRDGTLPYCNLCVAENDGCVASPSDEPECNQTSTGMEPPTSMTVPADGSTTASTAASTDAVDSSSTGEPSLCGNGVIDEEAGEMCDGDALPPDTSCMAAGFGEGVVGCTEDCTTVDYTDCVMYSECGNNEVANGEDCDGMNLNGHTCGEFPNLTGGGLACTADCELDPAACLPCVESDEECMPGQSVCCNPMDVCDGLLIQKECCQPSMGNCPV